ncbi:hypothetical protein CY34DRAFT_373604 [Suillus luteus UH-Slu-Lm8-n1]|uniref:Uncharacterized protein n=1 Tax=Suillus luteus UH-Slu-Lm8-n1 TaxID=930992 RepID=A0A0D0AWI1_9AGAM|nr:hypothetical protein CY34DRAFT_373604 [Suillus luteus UH-Slu-Lm8-n1]
MVLALTAPCHGPMYVVPVARCTVIANPSETGRVGDDFFYLGTKAGVEQLLAGVNAVSRDNVRHYRSPAADFSLRSQPRARPVIVADCLTLITTRNPTPKHVRDCIPSARQLASSDSVRLERVLSNPRGY